MTPVNLTETLIGIVGPNHVLTGDDADSYEQDWRRRARGKALCVVRPGSTEQVARVVKACAEHGVAIVPQGGNTSMVGGAPPTADGSAAILSLRRMNRVRSIDADAALAVAKPWRRSVFSTRRTNPWSSSTTNTSGRPASTSQPSQLAKTGRSVFDNAPGRWPAA